MLMVASVEPPSVSGKPSMVLAEYLESMLYRYG